MGMRLGFIGCTLFRPSIRNRQTGLYTLAFQKQCSYSASTTDWGRRQAWTEEEDRMVAQQMEKGMTDHEISSLLCNRSVSAIVNRRSVLATKGLLTKFTPKKRFTPAEDSRLLAARSQGLSWVSMETLFPHRTTKTLRKRGARLTATQPHSTSSERRSLQSWSAEEDALLLDLVKSSHKRSPWNDIANRIHRSINSVRRHYAMLVAPIERRKFLTGGSNAWSDAELEELDLLLDEGSSYRSIAIHLGRSLGSVGKQIRSRQALNPLNREMKPQSPWTREEKEQLAAMRSEGASRKHIARTLNRSLGSIDAMFELMNNRPRKQHIPKRWTTADAEMAFDLYKSGVSKTDIALRLGRTLIAISQQLRKMEIESQWRSSTKKDS